MKRQLLTKDNRWLSFIRGVDGGFEKTHLVYSKAKRTEYGPALRNASHYLKDILNSILYRKTGLFLALIIFYYVIFRI